MESTEGQAFGVQMEKVLDELLANKDRIVESPRDYVLKETPLPEELKQLTTLPFEVDIFIAGDKLVLSSRSRTSTKTPVMIDGSEGDMSVAAHFQRLHSPLAFHSHPDLPDVIANHPSPQDYKSFMRLQWLQETEGAEDKCNAMLIATPESLIVISRATKPDSVIDTALRLELDVLAEEHKKKVLYFRKKILESTSEETTQKTLEERDEYVDEMLKNLQDIVDEDINTEYASWDKAQLYVDKYMNPKNWK